MKIVVFGLTASSSWGNGHATLWRALCNALSARGHRVTFFERDVPHYAAHRDLRDPHGWTLRIYPDWPTVRREAAGALRASDVAIVTSYCPDGVAATRLVLDSTIAVRCFYDMDTPVTLERLERGEPIDAIDPQLGLGGFDLVLSYVGGEALSALRERLGARRVRPLYGSVDPRVHTPVHRANAASRRYAASYLGTYAADRQGGLETLFLAPARRLPHASFVLGGPMYPADFGWLPNLDYVPHVSPPEHGAFYGSAPLTVNVTRAAMARTGYCPSGRLFEAAACAVPVLSDAWAGLETFFEPGREILIARSADEALDAVARPAAELAAIGRAARRRVLAEHTADARAREMEALLQG